MGSHRNPLDYNSLFSFRTLQDKILMLTYIAHAELKRVLLCLEAKDYSGKDCFIFANEASVEVFTLLLAYVSRFSSTPELGRGGVRIIQVYLDVVELASTPEDSDSTAATLALYLQLCRQSSSIPEDRIINFARKWICLPHEMFPANQSNRIVANGFIVLEAVYSYFIGLRMASPPKELHLAKIDFASNKLSGRIAASTVVSFAFLKFFLGIARYDISWISREPCDCIFQILFYLINDELRSNEYNRYSRSARNKRKHGAQIVSKHDYQIEPAILLWLIVEILLLLVEKDCPNFYESFSSFCIIESSAVTLREVVMALKYYLISGNPEHLSSFKIIVNHLKRKKRLRPEK